MTMLPPGDSEACCWNDPRDSCPLPRGGFCGCSCHADPIEVHLHGTGALSDETYQALGRALRAALAQWERGDLERRM